MLSQLWPTVQIQDCGFPSSMTISPWSKTHLQDDYIFSLTKCVALQASLGQLEFECDMIYIT